jgi:CheY-like chemotaxis protein
MTESQLLSSVETTSFVKTLWLFQQKHYTGTVRLNAQVAETGRNIECFIFFENGCLTLADRTIPNPMTLVTNLARSLQMNCFDSVMEYVARRVDKNCPSPYQMMELIVGTRIVAWADIERVVMHQMAVMLERFLPYACTVTPEPEHLDIAYGADRHGIPWDDVLQIIAQRQKQWKQYLPALRSVEAIPYLRDGALVSITHEPTKQHLQKWVDGKRSFAEIAEGLGQDPLTLAPLYYRWTNERLIDFYFHRDELSSRQLPVVLSVDDSPIVQAMIRRSLCESYEVIGSESAMDALGVLSRRPVDLILLDVTMPEIDGLEFCRTIRRMSKFKNTPVIMLTAKDSLIDRAKGHMAGTTRYLTKPIDQAELLRIVSEYI